MLSRICRPFGRYLSGLVMTSSSRSLSILSTNSFSGCPKNDLAKNQFFPTTRHLKTSSSSTSEVTEETEKNLLAMLTPELCERLTGKITSKRFRLKNIQNELERLYQKKFPLPDSLTEEQWKILMEFNEMDLRVYYLVRGGLVSNFNGYYFKKSLPWSPYVNVSLFLSGFIGSRCW